MNGNGFLITEAVSNPDRSLLRHVVGHLSDSTDKNKCLTLALDDSGETDNPNIFGDSVPDLPVNLSSLFLAFLVMR